METTEESVTAAEAEANQYSTISRRGGREKKKEDVLLEATLFRLTQGLPRGELQLIVSESQMCESLLDRDIQLLEKQQQGLLQGKEENEDFKAIVESPFTPLDRFWTASALVGRLRGDLTLPRHPSVPAPLVSSTLPSPNNEDSPSPLLDLLNHPNYIRVHDNPQALLATHKKLMSHRSSAVFKRPVKVDEAPGYDSRILFPMDLSLVRKQIVARQILSYRDLHERVALISHNCVKFNGRESDYGLVAKEFELAGDDIIRHAVLQISRKGTPVVTMTTDLLGEGTDEGETPTAAATGVPGASEAAESSNDDG